MTKDSVDNRRFPRLPSSLSPAGRGNSLASEPLLINTSAGGMCLWLHDPPSMDRLYAIRWRRNGQKQSIQVRPVWLRPYYPAPDTENLQHPGGWFVGFKFVPMQSGASSLASPRDIPLGGQIEIDSLQGGDLPNETGQQPAATGGTIVSDHSIPEIRAAAESLLPILARYFRDVRLSLTRDRLEISAPFRSLAELNEMKAREEDRRAMHAVDAKSPLPLPKATQGDTTAAQLSGVRQRVGGRPVLVAAAGLLAVVAVWKVVGLLPLGERVSTARQVPTLQRLIPAWAAELDSSSRDGWMEVQARFGLTDARVLSGIRILKADDKYPAGHWLHDLSAYPAQVGRAFALLAGSGTRTLRDLGALTKDLEMRLVSGARFPDESPGDRHSLLSRELSENTVVLAVLDLLRRRQEDPATRDLLVALRRSSK